MSDNQPRFAPCHVSSQPTPCHCCSDHRRRIDQLLAERSASATAAAESMAMIRRLQREKSDAMLESMQFRRFAEDQMARYRSEIEALEIKFEPNIMCEPIGKRISFKNNQVVHFKLLEKPKEDDFSLELLKLHTYDDVVERVARHIGLDDPTKIRLTSHNCYSQQPKPQPIRYRGVEHLSHMLIHHNQTSDILYYEVLDIPLPELQSLKTLKVVFHRSTKDEVVSHTIRLPKNSTVDDVINDLKSKVELSRPDAELRLLEMFYHKIYKIFPPFEKIENINDQYWTLRAEEIPEEETNLGSQDRLIHVYHFMKDPNHNQFNTQQQVQNFGEPFLLVIHEGETLAEVKKRVQKKLQVPDEEFAKWNFAFLSISRLEYLKDSDVISSRFQRRDVYGVWEQYLGLEHTDTTPKRPMIANQNRHTYEKPVKIYN